MRRHKISIDKVQEAFNSAIKTDILVFLIGIQSSGSILKVRRLQLLNGATYHIYLR